MIKKLRRRFVLMVMGIVTLVLVAIFLVVFLSIRGVMERNTKSALQIALLSANVPKQPEEEQPPELEDRHNRGDGMPVFLFEMTEDGEASLIKGDSSALSEEELDAILDEVTGLEEDDGRLEDYGLSYARSGGYLAFVNTAATDSVMNSVVNIGVIVFAATMLVFFLLAVLLSKWAVRPTEKAWKQQRRFVADASHDLKTPLTIILSNADMALREDEANDGHIGLIREEAVRMKKLIEQMLQMARLDTVDAKPRFENVDLSALVEGSLLSFEPVLFEKGVELESEIEPNLCVTGDGEELRKMFEALLDNAGKYTPEREKVIVKLSQSQKKKAILSVRNTGVCMSREQLEHIFDRFYRAEDSRTSVGSFGLGLSIAQSIAHRHKSEITVESGEQIGVVFSVALPLKQAVQA
ncbi:MAG: HAMP domain-containing sensor histidine kinase [Clostridia bacterium]|nr:HAMP domain-containing sensor histidine kinase [Clostridia bacterium]